MPQPAATLPDAAPAPVDTLLSASEAAQYLRKSPRTLRLYVHDGRLRAYRVGGSVRFDRADLDAFAQVVTR